MSGSGNLQAFNPSEEQDIPQWPSPEPIPVQEERVYVFGMQMVKGAPQFRFIERPQSPDPSQDGPLAIRVPVDCLIVLRLDPALNWQFRYANSVTMGPMSHETTLRYFNLVPQIVNGRCREVRFNALRLNLPEGELNRDPYAIYFQIEQEAADDSPAAEFSLRIDPDVMNPGDRP